jgi:malonyl-CoA/methylmalonyl-CoA synthetase
VVAIATRSGRAALGYTVPMLLPTLCDPPSGEAVSTREGTLTYRELRDAAGRLAATLPAGERVAVWATSELGTVVGVVGALAAGVPFIPLNPKSGDRELEHVVRDARPSAVIAPAAAELPGVIARLPRIDAARCDGEAALGDEPDEGAPALVMYTSGTTGPPKGVVLSRAAIAHNLDALADAWAWNRDDVLAHALPLFHVHGLVLGLLGPLRLGGRLRHLEPFDVRTVAAALEADATMLFGVPTMYHRLAAAAEADHDVARALRRARLLVSGSAPLPAADHDRIVRACGQRIVERYGMTETLMITSVRHDGERRPGYVGVPLRGVQVRVADDQGATVPADDATIGGVLVRSPSLFDCYLGQPEATAQSFSDGWFSTGDLGTRTPDGELRLVGRRSTDLIKSGGHRIGAGEIESALVAFPGVAEAAVLGVPDADLGERIVAWVVAAGEDRPDPNELIHHVAALLTPHKRPREIRFVESLPRNAMGKVQKVRLPTH